LADAVSYHTREKCVSYVSKYFQNTLPQLSVYGFIPALPPFEQQENASEKVFELVACNWCCHLLTQKQAVACVLRAAKKDLNASEEEQLAISRFCKLVNAVNSLLFGLSRCGCDRLKSISILTNFWRILTLFIIITRLVRLCATVYD